METLRLNMKYIYLSVLIMAFTCLPQDAKAFFGLIQAAKSLIDAAALENKQKEEQLDLSKPMDEASRAKIVADLAPEVNILAKRAIQTRKFSNRDESQTNKVFRSTILSMGFGNAFYDEKNRTGMAMGDQYKLNWIVKIYNGETYVRVSILPHSKEGNAAPNRQDYVDFWNSIGQTTFLQNIEISPTELP